MAVTTVETTAMMRMIHQKKATALPLSLLA